MVKFVDLGVLYFSLVLPVQSRWTAGGPDLKVDFKVLGRHLPEGMNHVATVTATLPLLVQLCMR